MGKIGTDPEFRTINSSEKGYWKFSLLTNKIYKKDDEWIQEPKWHHVKSWKDIDSRYQKG
ncbi:hypothetical protein HK096_008474, partial [Nowakowskiella sp. JEL0078]